MTLLPRLTANGRKRPRTQAVARLPLLYSEECKYLRMLHEAREEAWGGVSPRGLTKSSKRFSLGAHPPWGLPD